MIQGDARATERAPVALEQELAELRGQIAAHRNELVIMVVNKARRDRLEWQIRERARRLVDVRARLAVIRAESA